MDQPELGMPSRDYYLKGRDDKVLKAYETMVKNVLVALGADKMTAETDATHFVDLEIDLANVSFNLLSITIVTFNS